MRSMKAISGRLTRIVALGVVPLTAVAMVSVVGASPAVASGGPTIANGFAGYTPGTTSPPNQFDALTLVSGGAASVNTASLTIVTQPASGTATAAPTSTNGIITYAPASGTTGTQTLTFAYCTPGNTYPSAGNCTTATISYAASVGEYMGANVANITGVIQEVETAVSLPPTAVQGSTVTASIAPVPTSVPASESGVTVNNASQFSVVMPVPKGFTYVPGSITVTGGDATTSGHYTATYCTGPVANACTAQIASGNYKTVYPYIETYLNPGTTVSGGSNVTLPTVTAQFTATGDVGTVQPLVFTEFVLVTSVQIIGTATFDGYPSCSGCASGNNPTYQTPSPLASTTITSAAAHTVTVTGVTPSTGPPAGGTSVTIAGTDLSGATAVDFGSTPGTITADSSNSVTATSPAGTGTVDVTVVTPSGVSTPLAADQFSFGTQVLTHLSTWTDPQACGIAATTTVPSLASKVVATLVAGVGGGGGGAASSDSGGSGGPGSSVVGTYSVSAGSSLTATSGCNGATAPHGSGVVSTGGAGGVGFSNGGSGGQGYYCAGVSIEGACLGTGGADGSGGGGGGSSALCAGTTCQVGDTPLVVAAGGGGGGESMCAGSNGGGGGTGGGGSSTPSTDGTGAGPSGTGGGQGDTSGDVGGAGGVNDSTGSASGSPGGGGSTTVSLGDSAGNGGGGGGYVGGLGSTATAGVDCGAGGGGGAGSAWSVNGSNPTFGTSTAGPSIVLSYYGFVGTKPAVTTQPTGTTVTAGQTATFTVAGTGNPSPLVQWEVSSDGGVTFTPIVGANATTLSVVTTASEDQDQYEAVLTNSIGSATSSPATLSVQTPPVVTGQPTGAVVDTGQTASFTAAASGNPTPTVQWQVSTDGGTTFNDVPGATSATYTFTTAAGESGDEYQAVFTNAAGSATSDPATLTLDTLPVVGTNPTPVTVIAGQSASFTASATAVPSPTVQWQVSTNGGSTFTNISGATNGNYSLVTALTQNGDQYRAAFTNPVGTVYSSAALLTVNPVPPLSITTTSLPGGRVYSPTDKVKYSATLTASSGNPPYQWKVTAGSLPNGLKLSKGKGTISGKASFAGSFTFTVEVLDKKGPGPLHLQNTATAQFTIVIAP